MKRTSLFVSLTTLALVSVVFIGGGCGKTTSPRANTSNTNGAATVPVNSAATPATVEDPGDPSGEQAADAATVEDVLEQMENASDQASSAVEESDEDVDSYTLPTEISE